jgi:hypothetical protein
MRSSKRSKYRTAPKALLDQILLSAFDGTNNDRNNLSLSGTKQSTAVGSLEQKVREGSIGNNVVTKYFAGLGTDGTAPGSTLKPGAVTAQTLATAEQAYKEFKEVALTWLGSNPNGQVSVMSVSFSRGGATDVAFKQLVYERGLTTVEGRVLVEPGSVHFAPSLMIDPVFTGVYGNAALPPGAAEYTTSLPMRVKGELPEIRIGMSIVADIAIGKRKAYEFFIGPLLKYKNESLRER